MWLLLCEAPHKDMKRWGGCQGWEGSGSWWVMGAVSVWGDDKVPEIDGGELYVLKATKSYILKLLKH